MVIFSMRAMCAMGFCWHACGERVGSGWGKTAAMGRPTGASLYFGPKALVIRRNIRYRIVQGNPDTPKLPPLRAWPGLLPSSIALESFMGQYTPPLRDMQFVLHELLNVEEEFKAMPAHTEIDAATVDQVLEEAGKFCAGVIFPLNQSGDEEGCTYKGDGVVTAPKGFKEAYKQYVEAGWPALSADPNYGGQGLPELVNNVFMEMINSANQAWGMYPGLSHGAYAALRAHGTPELQKLYLPKLVSGEWTGTMCLTEAHCGTDLGLLRTKAEPQADGSYLITGSKIFISAGEHDMSANIIHLVLARLPDAPAGTKGISLFLVPKFLVKADGSLGARNPIFVGAIEEKMGIHGNSTCVINL